METEINNLALWNKVEKTNPKYTKKAKVGGIEITSIAPQYQIKNATEQLGIYGKDWGFRNISLDYNLIEKYDLVVFKAEFFFQNGSFEIINSIKMFMDRNKTMVDDNFAKKVETDALTKALSKLGFNADIFLGKFDDSRYVNEMKNEFGKEDAAAEEKRLQEIREKAALSKTLIDLGNYFNSLSKDDQSVLKSYFGEVKDAIKENQRILDFISKAETLEDLETIEGFITTDELKAQFDFKKLELIK